MSHLCDNCFNPGCGGKIGEEVVPPPDSNARYPTRAGTRRQTYLTVPVYWCETIGRNSGFLKADKDIDEDYIPEDMEKEGLAFLYADRPLKKVYEIVDWADQGRPKPKCSPGHLFCDCDDDSTVDMDQDSKTKSTDRPITSEPGTLQDGPIEIVDLTQYQEDNYIDLTNCEEENVIEMPKCYDNIFEVDIV